MKLLTYIIGLFLLSGCASTVEQEDESTIVDVPRFGTITLIRIEPEPAPPEVMVYLHEELAAVIGNESFVTLRLPAGTNHLVFDWEDSPLRFEETVLLEPENKPELFLSLFRKFDVPEISRTTNSTDYTMEETLGFLELSPAIGKGVIRNLDPDFSFTAQEYQD